MDNMYTYTHKMSIYRVLSTYIPLHYPVNAMNHTDTMYQDLDHEFRLSNHGQCEQLMHNLKRAVETNAEGSTEHSFLPSKRRWFVMNYDCMDEHRVLRDYMHSKGITYTYQILYQLRQPYVIHYDTLAASLMIRQSS